MSTFHSASGFVYQRPEKYEYTYFRQKVGTTKVTGMAEFIGHISLPNEVMPPGWRSYVIVCPVILPVSRTTHKCINGRQPTW